MVAPALTATLVLWAAFELVLHVTELARRQGGTKSDRGTQPPSLRRR